MLFPCSYLFELGNLVAKHPTKTAVMATHWVGDQKQAMCGSVVQLVSNSSPNSSVCLQEAKKGIHTFVHGKRSGNKFVQISEIIK